MKKLYFKDIETPAAEIVAEMTNLYQALHVAAVRENNLHAYLRAEVSLSSLALAAYALKQPQCYREPAHYLIAEPADAINDLMALRMSYVYNGAQG